MLDRAQETSLENAMSLWVYMLVNVFAGGLLAGQTFSCFHLSSTV